MARVWRMWGILTFFVPSPLSTFFILKFFLGLHMALILFEWVHYTQGVFKWCPEKSYLKNTKKFGRVRRMWGILTFFIPSPFSTSLNFLKIFGTSYGLDIVEIGSLHLGGVQMISEKKSKSKNTKKLTRVRRMWGFLTFFVPSHFFASLMLKFFFGTLYDLDIVWMCSLHLRGVKMMSGRIILQKY